MKMPTNEMLLDSCGRIPFKITISNVTLINNQKSKILEDFRNSLKISFLPDGQPIKQQHVNKTNGMQGSMFQAVSGRRGGGQTVFLTDLKMCFIG